MSDVLVLNAGSSSLKYQLIDTGSGQVWAKGLIERIGEEGSLLHHSVGEEKHQRVLDISDHQGAMEAMREAFITWGPALEGEHAPIALGHRVVHGGDTYGDPTLIDDQVVAEIDSLSSLAPLHNPPALLAIQAARETFGDVPHVAVFDTAFHHTLPAAAYTYALDREVAKAHRIRRYGFHGTSHAYVSNELASLLGRPVEEVKSLILHLGNGASITAVDGGRSVDTSMGMTPLEGLVMGTRSGDLDPAILPYLQREAQMSAAEVDALLNRRSGLAGLAGSNDMRDVRQAAENGSVEAREALDVVIHRLKSYIGAYAAQLGRVDAIAFTAGVGENDAKLRAEVLSGLESLFGIRVDEARNSERDPVAHLISTDDSQVQVWVVPTNEELEIARQTVSAIS